MTTTSPVDLQVLADDEAADVRIPIPTATPAPAAFSAEQAGMASGGGLAATMRARLAQINAAETADLPIPGWGGDLLIRVGHLAEAEWQRVAGTNASGPELVVAATRAVLAREDDGTFAEIPGGFGPALAEILGFPENTPPTRLLTGLMADRPGVIANLCMAVVDWQQGRAAKAEEALGE